MIEIGRSESAICPHGAVPIAVLVGKQKNEKKAPAFLTCIINTIIASHLYGLDCNFNPQSLTTLTQDGKPTCTLSRRVDGAFPSAINPIAIWEIKEYYYTTTFGSRIADGIFETQLDGMELKEAYRRGKLNQHVQHLLIVDAYGTWWTKGKPHLCRLVDLLHMGYVDEVLFGREVLSRLPDAVKEWLQVAEEREMTAGELALAHAMKLPAVESEKSKGL